MSLVYIVLSTALVNKLQNLDRDLEARVQAAGGSMKVRRDIESDRRSDDCKGDFLLVRVFPHGIIPQTSVWLV